MPVENDLPREEFRAAVEGMRSAAGPVSIILVVRNRYVRDGLKNVLGPKTCIAMEKQRLEECERSHFESLSKPILILVYLEKKAIIPVADVARLSKGKDKKIVVIAEELNPLDLVTALQAGAVGYLLQDIPAKAMALSLELVKSGETVISGKMANVLVATGKELLSNRENAKRNEFEDVDTEILLCLSRGLSNKEISMHINKGVATVKVRITSLFKRLKVSNRTQLAIWAAQSCAASARHLNKNYHL